MPVNHCGVLHEVAPNFELKQALEAEVHGVENEKSCAICKGATKYPSERCVGCSKIVCGECVRSGKAKASQEWTFCEGMGYNSIEGCGAVRCTNCSLLPVKERETCGCDWNMGR